MAGTPKKAKTEAERAKKREAAVASGKRVPQPDGHRPVSGTPAFGGPLTHGATKESLVLPRAEELIGEVFEANPHLDAQRDGPAITRYSVILARIERVYKWLAEQDDDVFQTDSGKVHTVYDRLRQWENQATQAEDRLAIAPLTRARLGLDLQKAQANEEERTQARAARERLDGRLAELDGKSKDKKK